MSCKAIDPKLGLNLDEDYGALQLFSLRFLTAVARGEVDANALLREELAARGYDKDGVWVGGSQQSA